MKHILPGESTRLCAEWSKRSPADPEELKYLLLRVAYLRDDERGLIYHPPKLVSQLEWRHRDGKHK